MNARLLCEECGKPITVCLFNAHHQKYCNRSSCVRRRKQRRQREYHNRRYNSDESFREEKRRKSRQYMRDRRRREKAALIVLQADAVEISLLDIMTGVVSQLTDEDDPRVIQERLKSYSVRGRQLCCCAPVLAPPP